MDLWGRSTPGFYDDVLAQKRAYVQRLAQAAATGVNAPLPPARPSDLDAVTALASPPSAADDATFDALVRQGGSPLATPSSASFPSAAPATLPPPSASTIANRPSAASAPPVQTPGQGQPLGNPLAKSVPQSGQSQPAAVYGAPGNIAAYRAALDAQTGRLNPPQRQPTLTPVEGNPFAVLIPGKPSPQGNVSFDDLIPQGNAADWGPTTEIQNGDVRDAAGCRGLDRKPPPAIIGHAKHCSNPG